MNYERTPAS